MNLVYKYIRIEESEIARKCLERDPQLFTQIRDFVDTIRFAVTLSVNLTFAYCTCGGSKPVFYRIGKYQGSVPVLYLKNCPKC